MQKLANQKIVTRLLRHCTGRLLFAILSTACLLTGALPAMAQDKASRGHVTTESGTPISGASVTIVERIRKCNPFYGVQMKDNYNLWPIPVAEIERNNKAVLEQNPGYN